MINQSVGLSIFQVNKMFKQCLRVSHIVSRRFCAPTRKPEISSLNRLTKKAFGKYLLITNTVSSGVLMFIGDIIQQEIEFQHKLLPKRYDYGRLWRMFAIGVSQGPLHHFYYLWLSRVMPDRQMWTITKKILLDQLIMSPICIVEFFYGLALLESKTLKEANDELSEKFMEIYTVDWAVWPPTQFINFYFVPVRFQVLYINGITTLYNVFISYVKHRREVEEEKPSVL